MNGRSVEGALIDLTKKRLERNGLAQELMKKKHDKIAARDLNLIIQESWVGIREKGGNNSGPEVKLICETIGNWNREAWCMADQQSSIGIVEELLDIPSPIYASEHCMTVWLKTPKKQRVLFLPAPGAMVLWRHGTSERGHTGTLKNLVDGYRSISKKRYSWTIDQSAKYAEFYRSMQVYEGNTEQGLNGKGEVEREGGGHYFTKRGIEGNGTMKVEGFLKPW